MDRKLILIVGCGRSGTTLLRSILNEHNNVCFVSETFFFSTIEKKFPRDINLDNDKFLKNVEKCWWIKDSNIYKRINDFIKQTRYSTREELFYKLVNSAIPDSKATHAGEKTPEHIHILPWLLNTLDGIYVIHIVRDPRSVLNSYRKNKIGSNQAVVVGKEWVSAMKVHEIVKEYQNYFYLRYEDLILEQKNVIAQICQFLQVDYQEKMFEFYKRDDKNFSKEQSHHSNTLKPIFNESLTKWKTELPKKQLKIIEFICREYMSYNNYKLTFPNVKLGKVTLINDLIKELLHKYAIRVFRQKYKSYRANKRISNE
jgi:hypothetical protein